MVCVIALGGPPTTQLHVFSYGARTSWMDCNVTPKHICRDVHVRRKYSGRREQTINVEIDGMYRTRLV